MPAASSVLTDINCGSCTAVDLKKNKMEIRKYVVISCLKSFYDVCKILLPQINLSRIKELLSIRTDVVYEIICPST